MSPFTSNSEGTSLILDSLPMGVLFCDMDGVIRFVNKAYSDLLGQRPEELLGRDITDIIPHSRARVVLRDGRAEMGELCQLGPGNALPVIVNRIPVRDSQGRLAGMVSQAIFNDPEELKNSPPRSNIWAIPSINTSAGSRPACRRSTVCAAFWAKARPCAASNGRCKAMPNWMLLC